MKRRTWLLSAAGAAGALVVGWGAMPARSRLGHPDLLAVQAGEVAFNGWIKIASDGHVVMAMPRSEMGQGVHTALPMLVAEELDVPLDRVRIAQAGADTLYGNVAMLIGSLPFHPLESEGPELPTKVRLGQWLVGKVARELGINATGGSSSVADAWEVVRVAAATARASLLAAAAARWTVPVDELTVREGLVWHPSGKSAGYGALAAAASGIQPSHVRLKARKDWTVIGQPAPRVDALAKVTGQASYGLDVRLPGMLYASVRHCPMLGGALAALDEDALRGRPGVLAVVRLPAQAGSTEAFAVLASSWWQAQQAALGAQASWHAPAAGKPDTRQISAALDAAAEAGGGTTFHDIGDVAAAERQAARHLDASYRAPYLAHATMEPMNCTARVQGGTVELWVPTQVPQFARALAAKVAGVDADQVTVHVTQLGGGFGRRLEVDVVGQAVRVAMAANGKPVQLIWSREEDTTHDFYRPMHVAQLRATVDATGRIGSLRIQSAGDAITPRWIARGLPALAGPFDTPDKTTAEGLFDLPYGIDHQKMSHVATRMGVPVGFWRSVGHSHNAFFSESFIDELAEFVQQDPFALRRQLLTHAPRHLAVLDLAASRGGWGQALPAGRARGIALHESFGSIVAQVAEVSLLDGKPRVHRVVCAIDCGTVVNPGIVRQQLEGSVIFALTAALYGRIDIADGVVQQTSFPSYPMVSMGEAPVVEVHIMPSTRAPSGVGEPAVPPLAPAVANALFRLTGQRRRQLPLMG